MTSHIREILKNTTFKGLYALNVQKWLRNNKQRENRVTVLCLHRVSDDYDHFWDPIKPGNFELLIQYLVRYYELIPVSRINENPGKKPRVILSFDDGYYDFYTNVLPVLKHYSLPSNHNIVTNIVNGKQDIIWTEMLNFMFNFFRENPVEDAITLGGTEYRLKEQQNNLDRFYITVLKTLFTLEQAERLATLNGWLSRYSLQVSPKKMMGWKEIKECAAHGVEIGSHTQTHPILTTIRKEDEMKAELFESKAEIEKNLRAPATILAPPNGMCNDLIVKQAALAGYEYILGIGEHSVVQKSNGPTFMTRLNLISEPHNQMVLRIEELQSTMKHFLRKN